MDIIDLCHKLLKKELETSAGGQNIHKIKLEWVNVSLTSVDYDDYDTRKRYEERYDR